MLPSQYDEVSVNWGNCLPSFKVVLEVTRRTPTSPGNPFYFAALMNNVFMTYQIFLSFAFAYSLKVILIKVTENLSTKQDHSPA